MRLRQSGANCYSSAMSLLHLDVLGLGFPALNLLPELL